jgi:EmrB/QacA subfamily drug resistance transporter
MMPDTDASSNPPRRHWFGLALLSLGVSMIIVDATVVNVAIPTIIRDLDLRGTDAEWLNTIYSLVFASFLISVGRAGDLWGRRRLFLVGVVVFVGASLWAGQSSSAESLIAARVVQGLGGAMILPSTLSSVNTMFRGPARAIAFGVWGAVIGGMAALGPLVGGYLTTDHSWRWIFYINLPVGILAFVGVLRLVPAARDAGARRGFDPLGVLSVSLGLAALVFALIEGQRYGWIRPIETFSAFGMEWPFEGVSVVLPAAVLSAILLTAFVAIERARSRSGRAVLVDLDLFQIASFRYGNIAVMIVTLGELGLVFVLPLFLQSALGYSALRTGVILVALAAGAFLAGGLAAQLARRHGSRLVVLIGLAVEVVALAMVAAAISPEAGGWILAGPLFVYGVGIGLATAQLTNAILVDVPPRASGQASGIQSTSRQVGSALGIAVLGTLLIVGLGTRTEDRLENVPGLPPDAVESISQLMRDTAGAALPGLREMPDSEAIVTEIESAFSGATRTAALVAGGWIGVGFLAALRLPRDRADRRETAAAG